MPVQYGKKLLYKILYSMWEDNSYEENLKLSQDHLKGDTFKS